MIHKGLEQTKQMWPSIRIAFNWVHRMARVLKNEASLDGVQVRQRLRGMLGAISRWKSNTGELESGIAHLLKVTRSYWSGLFYCYDIEGLPKTNNDLEHAFGQWRHHQRRCTGRKVAPRTSVTRGRVQLVAALATRDRSFHSHELAQVSYQAWRQVRQHLEQHRQKRLLQRRFRRSPITFLAELEQKFIQLTLPP